MLLSVNWSPNGLSAQSLLSVQASAGSLRTSVWSSVLAPTWGASSGHVGHGACSRVEAANIFAGQTSFQELFSHHQLSQILLEARLQA